MIATPNYHPDLGDAFQCMKAEEHNEEIICMIETVSEQPTAYSVDKIVEQLKDMSGIQFEEKHNSYQLDWCIETNKAIEIVKGAAKDE